MPPDLILSVWHADARIKFDDIMQTDTTLTMNLSHTPVRENNHIYSMDQNSTVQFKTKIKSVSAVLLY